MNADAMKAIKAKLAEAINNGDTDSFVNELNDSMDKSVQDMVEERVMAKYNELKDVTDEQVMAQRGINPLTKEEKDFYNGMIRAAKDELTNYEVTLPITIETKIYDDVVQDHELLSHIDFVDSKGITEWIMSSDLNYAAAWGDLNDEITTEGKASFYKVEFSQYKLSAYIPVPKTMLDLGLTWLDQFVTTYLAEIIARKLEDAIVNGTGQKMPVGMIKTVDVKNQTVPAVDKTAEKLEDLSTTTVGAIAAKLTKNGTRKVSTIDLVVNPVDYWKVIYPALFYTNFDGQIIKANLPVNIYTSIAVPQGKMVAGLLTNYFATMGFGGTTGKVEWSDEFKFLSDVRTYKTRLVAYGTPKDNDSFFVYDISALLEAAVPTRTRKGTTTSTTPGN